MWDTNGGKFPRVLYNLNVVRKKSGKKYEKTYQRTQLILQKQAKYGETKWVQKTLTKALARCKKYGISIPMVQDYLTTKWYKDLAAKLSK